MIPKSMSAPSATDTDDTIAAISTPPGEGGVGIVRLSGPRALEIAAARFRSSRGKDPLSSKARVFHGHWMEQGTPIDEVLLHCMRAPHSYTREDVVEINAHGGAGPVNAILEACLAEGARLAAPGEFTMRAFLNGRIDLVQAEAVIDQIRARTKAGLQAASAAASGTLSRALYALSDRLAYALAQIEAAVDFPEEDTPDYVTPALLDSLREAADEMQALLDTAEAGRLCREGASVAIAGRPNVGKSSLFNALLRDARAIVSQHAGTTRDRIEEYIAIGGVPVKLIDTAGQRDTDDEVEQIGVAMARQAMEDAQAVLFVADAHAGVQPEDAALAAQLAALGTPVLLVWNKTDLAPAPADASALHCAFAAVCGVSAKSSDGIRALEQALETLLLGGLSLDASQPMLTRLHQREALRRAQESLLRLLQDAARSPEFLALDLRQALDAIGEITGETTPDDILGTIFASFCIGK
jgi:tRNA modification GTPase